MCGGLDLVVWWFSLLGGFGYMAPGFLVWICGGCLRKLSICGGSGVPVLDVWWWCGCVVVKKIATAAKAAESPVQPKGKPRNSSSSSSSSHRNSRGQPSTSQASRKKAKN